MATWSKAELATDVLERLGVKAAGQSASAEDQVKVESVIDSVHAEFRRLGIVPFATSAVPEWAQVAMSKYVAGEVASHFGITGQRRMEIEQEKEQGRLKLWEQCSVDRQRTHIRARYY